MGEKLNKVKQHVKDNYKTYIVGGVCLIVGALAAGAAHKYTTAEGDLADVTNTFNNHVGVANHSPISNVSNTIITQMAERSTPSNIVQSADGTRVWASQNEAARDLGVPAIILSRHLRGHLPDVNGEKFHVVPKLNEEAVKVAA